MKLCGGIGTCGVTDGGGIAATTFSTVFHLLLHSQCLLNEPWPSQAFLPNKTSVDIIIVGSGTAGSALAARLAETNLTVLLLEAGGDPPIESIIPGFHPFLRHSQYDWNFTAIDHPDSGNELRLGPHQRHLYAGKVLGGSDSIGYMVYNRPFPSDFDEWADILKDASWNWNNVLPYFKKTEKMAVESIKESSSSHYHGNEGEIEVTRLDEANHETKEFLNAFEEIGFNVVKDQNNPEALGKNRAYYHSYTIKEGRRQSTLTSMLNNVASKENLYVLKNAFVTKILLKNQTAYGVKVSMNDNEWEFYANKEVVVSAGVYNSPKLLLLSGIGPKRHLGFLDNVKLIHDLPVGTNLQQRFNSHVFLAAESNLCPSDKYSKFFEVIKYLYNRTGSLSIPKSLNAAADYILKDSLTPNVPDFAMFPTCVPKKSNYFARCLQTLDYTREVCSHLHSINKKYELFPISVVLRRPKSKGLIRIASNNPFHKPLIYSGAFIEEDDLENFPEAIESIRSLTNTTYFKSKNAFIVDLGLKSCQGLKWPEDVKCTVRNSVHTSPLAAGTVAMGTVLDSRMKVLGIQGLRVVDASAMPTVMPNSAVVVLAERAADLIKEDYGLLKHYH